ncbi:MBL fold metallo-hydrolase [Natronomonas sp. EA1]|uniref:MBL fold metallo-hydrolase n=1 Tax=Natronomonas sp. EA1 TaxID=3421655 RepID=UPI003EC01B97
MIRHDGLRVSWLGYATLRIEGSETVYFDPGRYGVLDGHEPKDGDVVCVTHDHHYDTEGIRRVAKPDATVVLFEGINTHRIDRDVDRPADLPYAVRTVDTESDILVGDVIVRTVNAYNEPDGPRVRQNGDPIHPKGLGCGFLVTVDDVTVFWPGDTDVLDGHEHLDVSLFCPPIGGAYTMDRHEAAALAEAMDPDLVLPIHYDTFEAIETDSGAFAADVAKRGVPVVLDERE